MSERSLDDLSHNASRNQSQDLNGHMELEDLPESDPTLMYLYQGIWWSSLIAFLGCLAYVVAYGPTP